MKNYISGAILCLIATVSWGGMFPIMDHALKYMDPFYFTAIRYTVAFFIFAVLLMVKEGKSAIRFDGHSILLSWIFGTLGFAGFGFLVFLGQQLAGEDGAITASVLMATMPMQGIFVSWVLHRKKPDLVTTALVLLSFIGVMVVITKGDIMQIITHPAGYYSSFLMIGGALCWVLYSLGASFFPNWSPYKYTAITTLMGLFSVYSIVFILTFSHILHFPSMQSIETISSDFIYMILFAGFIGVLSWNVGNSIITPINGVLFMDVVPITAFIVSISLGNNPVAAQFIGLTITASALVLNNLYQRYKLSLERVQNR